MAQYKQKRERNPRLCVFTQQDERAHASGLFISAGRSPFLGYRPVFQK
jgi:hypothetical protein